MAVIHYAGTVIRAYQVPDKRGVNPKDRPVLLVENFSDTDAEVYCVAITGKSVNYFKNTNKCRC